MTAISGALHRESEQRSCLTGMRQGAESAGLDVHEIWHNEKNGPGDICPAFFMHSWNAEHGRSALSTAPFFCDKHRFAIIADVRLDDRANLCAALGQPIANGEFPADCDLLLEAYGKWGSDCPKHLIGDYAFVIWDPAADTLFCARDHIGAKSFYYVFTSGNFTFSSDINIVLGAFEEIPALNENHIARKLVDWHHCASEDTSYEGVKKLPRAHSLTISPDKIDLHRYWSPEDLPPLKLANDDAYAKALFDLVEKAVIDRLRTGDDNETGQPEFAAHVSGGLDSSAIAVIANDYFRARGEPIPAAFSWQPAPDPNEPLSPEHSWIEAMVADQNLDMQYIAPNADDIYAMFLRDGTREPIGGTLINEQAIQKTAAKQGINVILSGWGGDEFISHNGRAHFPELFRSMQWRKLISELRDFDGFLLKTIFTQAVLPSFWPSFPEILKRWRERKKKMGPAEKSYIKDAFRQKTKVQKPKPVRFFNTHDTQLNLLANGHVTERIELWADNARSMGIEYRYPLLDRRIMEFAFSIPVDQYKRGRWKRWIFRNAMKDVLPDTVLWNLSKLETVRVDAILAPLAEAFGRIGDDLRSGKLKTTRGQYVDMPGLINDLDADKFRQNGKLGPTRAAVEFLDFE